MINETKKNARKAPMINETKKRVRKAPMVNATKKISLATRLMVITRGPIHELIWNQ